MADKAGSGRRFQFGELFHCEVSTDRRFPSGGGEKVQNIKTFVYGLYDWFAGVRPLNDSRLLSLPQLYRLLETSQ